MLKLVYVNIPENNYQEELNTIIEQIGLSSIYGDIVVIDELTLDLEIRSEDDYIYSYPATKETLYKTINTASYETTPTTMVLNGFNIDFTKEEINPIIKKAFDIETNIYIINKTVSLEEKQIIELDLFALVDLIKDKNEDETIVYNNIINHLISEDEEVSEDIQLYLHKEPEYKSMGLLDFINMLNPSNIVAGEEEVEDIEDIEDEEVDSEDNDIEYYTYATSKYKRTEALSIAHSSSTKKISIVDKENDEIVFNEKELEFVLTTLQLINNKIK